jgi:SPW repeat-containing protein
MAVKPMMKHWQDPVTLILGAWLIVSPWALKYQGEANATRAAVILGILIGAIALIAVFRVMPWEEWANLVLGVCVAISPWVLRFSGNAEAKWNDVIVGIVVAALALWTLDADKDLRVHRQAA